MWWYVLFGVFLGILVYFKIIKPVKYWEERGIIHEPAWPILGNMQESILMKKHMMNIILDLYNKYPDKRYVGIMQFTSPALLIRDLELIKQITVKEFDHFHDHQIFSLSDEDILFSKSLITLNGEQWRKMRATLSPAFTSSKMRIMYQLMAECAENFVGHFKGKEQVAVEMKDIFGRFATDVIASTAFGINVNSLNDSNNKFYLTSLRLTNFSIFVILKIFLLKPFPFLSRLLGIQIFSSEITNFFRSIVKDNITKREQHGIVRPDLIHLLMEARKGHLKQEDIKDTKDEGFAVVEESQIGKSSKQIHLSDDDIVAQAMLFFFAGFDTASTASSFLAHQLAVNPDIQKKLQDEIDAVNEICRGKISYETLLSLKYLDQVVSESLRLWPPAFQTDRLCTRDFEIQPKNPGEKKIVVEKGTLVIMPVIGIHRNPEYFPEPNKFDPERFSDENRSKIVSGSYMPFGAGPRNCIGSRFALLEIKTLFYHLLSKFDIIPVTGTQIPIRIDPRKASLMPKNGFRLGFRPRKVPSY